MPSAIVTSETALLGPRGWLAAANVGSVQLLGIDRYGQISECAAQLEFNRHERPRVFLATASTFGFLAAQSVVLDSDGKRCCAGEIVRNGSVSNLRFETVSYCRGSSPDAVSFSDLWNILGRASAAASPADVVIRCRTSYSHLCEQIEMFRARFARAHCFGSHVYCTINRALLNETFLHDWSAAAIALCGICFEFPDSLCRIEKQYALIGLWIISAFNREQRGFNLKYDGIQYTVCAYIVASDGCPRPVERGMCACFEADTFSDIKLTWSDPSWNPVANGFVILPG